MPLSLDPTFYVALYVYGAATLLVSVFNIVSAPGKHGLRLHLVGSIVTLTLGLSLWGGEGVGLLDEPTHRVYGGLFILFGQVGLLYVLYAIHSGTERLAQRGGEA